MDALGKFYIFREAKLNSQINDRSTVKSNTIFDITVQEESPQMDTQRLEHAVDNRKTPYIGIHNGYNTQ